jgi:hypothetical protein
VSTIKVLDQAHAGFGSHLHSLARWWVAVDAQW